MQHDGTGERVVLRVTDSRRRSAVRDVAALVQDVVHLQAEHAGIVLQERLRGARVPEPFALRITIGVA